MSFFQGNAELLILQKSVNIGRKDDVPRSGVSQPKTTLFG
jgi:hypothetical protein